MPCSDQSEPLGPGPPHVGVRVVQRVAQHDDRARGPERAERVDAGDPELVQRFGQGLLERSHRIHRADESQRLGGQLAPTRTGLVPALERHRQVLAQHRSGHQADSVDGREEVAAQPRLADGGVEHLLDDVGVRERPQGQHRGAAGDEIAVVEPAQNLVASTRLGQDTEAVVAPAPSYDGTARRGVCCPLEAAPGEEHLAEALA